MILSDQLQESTQRLISNKEPEAGRPNPTVPPASSALPFGNPLWSLAGRLSGKHSITSFPRGMNILPGCGLYQPQLFIVIVHIL